MPLKKLRRNLGLGAVFSPLLFFISLLISLLSLLYWFSFLHLFISLFFSCYFPNSLTLHTSSLFMRDPECAFSVSVSLFFSLRVASFVCERGEGWRAQSTQTHLGAQLWAAIFLFVSVGQCAEFVPVFLFCFLLLVHFFGFPTWVFHLRMCDLTLGKASSFVLLHRLETKKECVHVFSCCPVLQCSMIFSSSTSLPFSGPLFFISNYLVSSAPLAHTVRCVSVGYAHCPASCGPFSLKFLADRFLVTLGLPCRRSFSGRRLQYVLGPPVLIWVLFSPSAGVLEDLSVHIDLFRPELLLPVKKPHTLSKSPAVVPHPL